MARPPVNHKGSRFGNLVVESFLRLENQGAIWNCLCDCGNKIEARARHLVRGYRKSCGCLYNRLEFGKSSFNAVLRRYKIQAKKRNLDFDLSENEFLELTQQNCFYCNKPPNQVYARSNAFGTFTYNGIDRLNPFLGYKKENCCTCCWYCNVMKNNRTVEEFYKHIETVLDHRKTKQ